jgi:hypothetical protein
MLQKRSAFFVLVLALVLTGGALVAEEAPAEAVEAGSFLAPYEACASRAPAVAPSTAPEASLLATLASCTATCQNGSTVTCTGSSCSAVDANCPAQRGYCTGTTSGTKYCHQCCPNPTPCSFYEGRSCSTNQPCMERNVCAQCVCVGGSLTCP